MNIPNKRYSGQKTGPRMCDISRRWNEKWVERNDNDDEGNIHGTVRYQASGLDIERRMSIKRPPGDNIHICRQPRVVRDPFRNGVASPPRLSSPPSLTSFSFGYNVSLPEQRAVFSSCMIQCWIFQILIMLSAPHAYCCIRLIRHTGDQATRQSYLHMYATIGIIERLSFN